MSGHYDDPFRGRTMTLERPRHPEDDVAAARAAVGRTRVPFGGSRPLTLADRIAGFVRVYGWRAYALPILLAVTVVALVTMKSPAAPAAKPQAAGPGGARGGVPSAPKAAPSSMTLKSDVPNGNVEDLPLAADSLPAGPAYTKQGAGTFHIVPGTSPKVGSGRLWRYSVDVEDGITGFDAKQFAAMVVHVLSDSRSWAGHGIALQRVDSGQIDFHVSMTSSMTVRQFCGYSIQIETSCYAQAYDQPGLTVNRVVLNEARWVRGSPAYLGDLSLYRIYMINHEDGHALGHAHAHMCLPGGLAPVMMQQTISLKSSTGKSCGANPWPYPPGAKGAPGIEMPGT